MCTQIWMRKSFDQGWHLRGSRGAMAPPSGNPSPSVGENLTNRRGMNGRNDMKLSNFDSSCSLEALHSQPPRRRTWPLCRGIPGAIPGFDQNSERLSLYFYTFRQSQNSDRAPALGWV